MIGSFASDPNRPTTTFYFTADGAESITLESLGLDKDEWISLLEVTENGILAELLLEHQTHCD